MDVEEKVLRIYEIFHQRVFNQDRLLAERTSIFLLSSSILFAGFAMLGNNFTLLRILLPCVGILLSFLMWNVASASVRELRLWLSCCRMIEQEENVFKDLKERELVPHSTWANWWSGKSRYIGQERYPLYSLPPVARWEKWMYFGRFSAGNMYRFYIPGIFFAIWTASLIWVLS
ncbi:hypothetical protein M1N47_03330 [Dehalococcoidia bacterium]|nr:hypothetical protein [Dehalococcoidia bacterium]MCL0074481.1 hypothetical protein [Dehalococcoidia bacterium]